MKKSYTKPADTRDLREQGRCILAHGEVTGHAHEVIADPAVGGLPSAQYFEEPGSGRRILMIDGPHVLRHEEHGAITLDPAAPAQVRQGDVLLHPIAPGVYDVIRQSEYDPSEVRQVLD
jgi:hypothetical protein